MTPLRTLVALLLLSSAAACRGIGEPPDPLPPPEPGVERTVDERMEEVGQVAHRMNRVQARAGRLEPPPALEETFLPDLPTLRRDEGVRLMMRDIGRAAEGTAFAADRMREALRDPGMTGDPEMRAHLERMSEHLAALADQLEEGLADLEDMRARLYQR